METATVAPKSNKKNTSKSKKVKVNETPELKVVAPVVTPEVAAEVKTEKAPQKKRGPKGPWKRLTKIVKFVQKDGEWKLRGKGRPKPGVEVISREVSYNWQFNGTLPE